MKNEHRIVVRRAVLFGVPFLYIVLGLLHPANPELGDETALFVGLHYAQLVLIGGLAYMFWLLVDGLDAGAAGAARALILPFVIVYTAVDDPLGYLFYFGAGLLWLAVVLAVVSAHRPTAPRPALVLMTIGAFVFVLGHARPMGPIGMALFLAGIVWLELRPRRQSAEHAAPVQTA